MINDNLLWTADEYEAVVDYKANSYNKINVLLSRWWFYFKINNEEKKEYEYRYKKSKNFCNNSIRKC